MIHAVTMQVFNLDPQAGSHEKPDLLGGACLGMRWGDLASGTYLRLGGHSLGCLPQGPATGVSLWSGLCPPIYGDKSTAGKCEVFEDMIRELQDLVRLEVQCASSSLVVMALSRPNKVSSSGFYLTSRYSFCGIHGTELEGLELDV